MSFRNTHVQPGCVSPRASFTQMFLHPLINYPLIIGGTHFTCSSRFRLRPHKAHTSTGKWENRCSLIGPSQLAHHTLVWQWVTMNSPGNSPGRSQIPLKRSRSQFYTWIELRIIEMIQHVTSSCYIVRKSFRKLDMNFTWIHQVMPDGTLFFW